MDSSMVTSAILNATRQKKNDAETQSGQDGITRSRLRGLPENQTGDSLPSNQGRAEVALPETQEHSEESLCHSLVGEGDADFVGDFEGVLYTGADGWAVEVVAGKVETGEVGAKLFNGGETSGVAEIVLGERARPDSNVRKDRLISNIEQWSNFAVNQSNHFLWRFLENGGIGDTSQEAGE